MGPFLGLGCLLGLSLLAVGCAGGPAETPPYTLEGAEESAHHAAAPHEAAALEAEAGGKRREALRHYTAAIEALPEGTTTDKDFQLREKCIRLVLALEPPPAVPEEARRFFERGEAKAKEAKEESGWSAAALEFERGLRIAPWDARSYYNRSLVQELSNRYKAAARSLLLYLLAAPEAPDQAEVVRKIAGLEGKVDVSGIWQRDDDEDLRHWEIEIQGNELVIFEVHDKTWTNDQGYEYIKGKRMEFWRLTFEGRRIHGLTHRGLTMTVEGEISEDNHTIRFSVYVIDEWLPWKLTRVRK